LGLAAAVCLRITEPVLTVTGYEQIAADANPKAALRP
jgi:hypothetical protein